jgi:hypothetical protein
MSRQQNVDVSNYKILNKTQMIRQGNDMIQQNQLQKTLQNKKTVICANTTNNQNLKTHLIHFHFRPKPKQL